MRAMLALALVLATPAIACDPDSMEQAISEVCGAATRGAEAAKLAATPLADVSEAAAMQASLARARQHCMHGDPAEAAWEATRLARFAGRIEARTAPPHLLLNTLTGYPK